MAPVAKNPLLSRPAGKLTSDQKLARHDAWLGLSQDVHNAQEDYADRAKQIAKKHHRTLGWARRQLHLGARKTIKTRGATAWNGFMQQELSQANEGLTEGSKIRLPAFVKAHSKELEGKYQSLTIEQRDLLKLKVEETRMAKITMARANPKAVRKDVDATFVALEQEFFALEQRTGCKVFFMAVRGEVEHHNDPKVYMGPETEKFFKEILNMNPGKFAMQYEAYIVGGTAGLLKSTKQAMQDDISESRTRIADGLDAMLKKYKIPTNCKSTSRLMNYDNYEKKIVEVYGVELRGWPCEQFINPGGCRWVKLDEAELVARVTSNKAREAAGEQVYKARKTGKGKGKTAENVQILEDIDMTPAQ